MTATEKKQRRVWRDYDWQFEPDAARRYHLRVHQDCIVPVDVTRRELRELLPKHAGPRVEGAAVTELILAGYRQATIARHYDVTRARIAQMHTVGSRVFGYSLLGVLGILQRGDS